MAKVEHFEDLNVWKTSYDICLDIYKLVINLKDYGFKDQIQRASISITNNIAEGFERYSNKEFIRFLYIAKGSAGEVRNMLILGKDLGYIGPDKQGELNERLTIVGKQLGALIKSIGEK